MTPEGTYTSFDVYCDMTPGNESWLVSFSCLAIFHLHMSNYLFCFYTVAVKSDSNVHFIRKYNY